MMKIFFKKLMTWLGKTWVWTLLLVLLAALAVWFLGPLLAVDDYKFWEGASARLLSISVLFLAWGLFIVFDSWNSTRQKKEQGTSDGAKNRLLLTVQMEKDEKQLRKLFKKAVRTLKTASLYRGRSERWRDELPWYLLMGPAGSGKSSLIKQSGLAFPLNNLDPSAESKSGDSTFCEWYFGEHGVLIDTPSRYLKHGPETVESHSWKTLLGLLRARRRNRPLNGLVITVPIELLDSDDTSELMALAAEVRDRLKDIRKQLRVDFPVYLVLSKADEISGFEAFFDHLSREESDQVLGVSFAKDQVGNDLSTLRYEFEELLQRLNGQVVTRMQQEQNTTQRARGCPRFCVNGISVKPTTADLRTGY